MSARGMSLGLLCVKERGDVEADKLGPLQGEDGPGVGAVLGMIALAYSGRLTGQAGPFIDPESDFSTDDVARIGAELDAGSAAVAILADPAEAEQAIVELTRLGGRAEIHALTREALELAGSHPSSYTG